MHLFGKIQLLLHGLIFECFAKFYIIPAVSRISKDKDFVSFLVEVERQDHSKVIIKVERLRNSNLSRILIRRDHVCEKIVDFS